MRILILDDQDAVVSMLARVCTGEGHEVYSFTSSPEALIALRTEHLQKTADIIIANAAAQTKSPG